MQSKTFHDYLGSKPCAMGSWVMASIIIVGIVVPTNAIRSVRPRKTAPARPFLLRGTQRRLLDRAEQFLADEQWDDAVAAVMRLLESENLSLVAVGEQYYVSLSEYCHRLLAKLPADGLARYRDLVEATAESWYRQGIEKHDQNQLQRVVDRYFCSRWGDDALFAIGELALQRGDYQAARNAWLQISPRVGESSSQLTFPGTNLSLAAVQARLVLVSLREGDWLRAERELADLREGFPAATGRLAGREVVFVDQLTDLLKQARQWPVAAGATGWHTFAANSQRTNSHVAPNPKGPYELVWSQSISNERLSIFPVVVNGLVVYQDATSVRALQLADGEPAFYAQGEVFRSPIMPQGCLGRPRHTLTASDHFLFGVTTAPLGPMRKSNGADALSVLWGLDLQREGAIAFHQLSEDASVAFVGAPVIEGTRVFVPIRSNKQTARAGIACYDLSTGQRCWQRWLCRANTPATGRANELASNLLTFDSGILYANTNLGAVAAVRADDGRVMWLRTYERQSAERGRAGDYAYYRGPSPCIFHRGVVYVLPTDGKTLLAIDAATGTQLWQYAVDDLGAQLIGVTDERVALSNNGLQVLERQSGKLAGQDKFGLVLGSAALRLRAPHSEIMLPRGDSLEGMINSFDGKNAGTHYDGFDLPEQGGANLLVADNYLIAAGPSQLSVYRYQTLATSSPANSQTSTKE